MSVRFSRFCSPATPAVLATCLLWSWSGRAAEPQRGRPIEFSDPGSKQIATNLNQLGSKRDGLRELEQDLFKPLQSFSLKGSLDGVEAPPVRMAPYRRPLSKKEKERLEQRRNWFLKSPDDLTSGPTVEEIFHLPEYGPDGKEKSKKSSVEKYYERLDRERLAERGLLKQDELLEARERSESLDDLKEQDYGASPGGLTEQERTLRRLFNSQAAGTVVAPEPGRSSFSDVFGQGNSMPSAEQLESHKFTMKQFEQLFNSSHAPVTGAEPFNSLSGLSSALTAPAPGGWDNLPGASSPGGVEAAWGAMTPPLGVSGLQDFSAKGFEPLTPSAAQPKFEMPKVARPPSVMDFPQRKF